jgi:hypothetical protein
MVKPTYLSHYLRVGGQREKICAILPLKAVNRSQISGMQLPLRSASWQIATRETELYGIILKWTIRLLHLSLTTR